jgi:hypothetical protein
MESINSLYRWVLLNGAILLNVVLCFIENVCDKADIAIKAIKDSSIPDTLIFRKRNESPWLVKENAGHVIKGVRLCYSVTHNNFFDFSETSMEDNKMEDIILAEVVDESGNSVCDMSRFFHSMKWTFAPSIYECVIVNMLLSKIVLSDKYLESCSLNVMTLTNPSLTFQLSSSFAKEPFVSWENACPVDDAPSVNDDTFPVNDNADSSLYIDSVTDNDDSVKEDIVYSPTTSATGELVDSVTEDVVNSLVDACVDSRLDA